MENKQDIGLSSKTAPCGSLVFKLFLFSFYGNLVSEGSSV